MLQNFRIKFVLNQLDKFGDILHSNLKLWVLYVQKKQTVDFSVIYDGKFDMCALFCHFLLPDVV